MVLDGALTKNMRLLAHHDLDGYGNGGEGLAIQTSSDGRRILYIAHERAPKDFTSVDVTDPQNPKTVLQTNLPHAEVRSNSLALVGDLLLVAYQTVRPGLSPAGMGVYDVKDPEHPKQISFFDTSGPYSRGVHCLWFVDGRYAHLSTGASDFQPHDQKDDQFYMIVDLDDPANPKEVGRWWLPGTRVGDSEPRPDRHTAIDTGFRLHNANVYPERPDRAYLGYIDGGVILLDVADYANPKMISRLDYHPPMPGFTHTVLPLFSRDILIVTDEAVRVDCEDWPKLTWVLDASHETNPIIVSTLPMPNKEDFCKNGGRFGAHNIHENQPVPTSWISESIIVGAYFNGGIRVHDVSDPFRPEEIAFYVPPPPSEEHGLNINDVYVDENRIVYAIDRWAGGLYILEMDI